MRIDNSENRREFFSKITKGIAGITLLSIIHSKVFSRSRRGLKNVKVRIHDNAVKRTK